MKRITKTAAEVDVTTKWRRYYCYTQRAGVISGIKRQIRRRERRDAKAEVRNDRDN
jgi:cell division protein FtsI/penicillin-binding protein 2